MAKHLSVEQLYRKCDPASLGVACSDEAVELDTIIGQERAVHSLRFGLDIKERGFNIFVAGIHGTGRTTAIERFLKEIADQKPVPVDWCYVHNFSDPTKPNAIKLPAGQATGFQTDLQRCVSTAIADLKANFKSDEYNTHKTELVNKVQQQKQEIINNLGEKAQEQGFVLQPTPMGLLTIPVREGRPISEQEFLQLSEKDKKAINQKQASLASALDEATRIARNLDEELRTKLEELNVEVTKFAIQHHFDQLKNKYQNLEEIPEFIEQVRQDILANTADFVKSEEELETQQLLGRMQRESPLQKYAVNVIVDNSKLKGAPVVLELNPTFYNIIGRTEHEVAFGALVTNFMLIRSGSLHRANGGFLVLPVEDLLRNPFAWEVLKRSLVNKEVLIEDMGERIGFSTRSLRPEPIPLDIKVILIGDPSIYQILLQFDEQFNEIFKVKADFDVQMPRTDKSIQEFISFVCTLCRTENLHHLDQSALARVVEHGSRMSGDQEKLSTRFGEMADVIREASYYAEQEKARNVTAEHVERAIDERFYRSSLIHDRIQEMIARDQIRIDVTGEVVGQVNGLSVLGLRDITFGQPSRITASVSLGQDGVMNIEREAEMSGPIHTKGVLILSGYLSEKFALDKPLSLSARLVFEQSYSGVEGDSASSTELYALLSALSDLPVKQGIAVTGSVNQKGEVQVIGGVNEKIEGFFEVCRARGLTGEQGVIIPEGNTSNLMLKKSVVEAVKQKQFHIWAVKNVDEGIKILTGVQAGGARTEGGFEANSVYARVDAKLKEMAENMVKFK